MNTIASDIITQNFEGQAISIRADGYWNLTQMCQAHGKNVADFLRLKSTKDYLSVFYFDQNSVTGIPIATSNPDTAITMGIPIVTSNPESKNPVEVVNGGRSPGTWAHEEVALKCAAWLNPKFEVWVYRTIKKLLRTGEVRLKDELIGLQAALSQAYQTIEECDVEIVLLQHEKDKLRRQYLEAVCIPDGDYSDYDQDPDCHCYDPL